MIKIKILLHNIKTKDFRSHDTLERFGYSRTPKTYFYIQTQVRGGEISQMAN